VVEIALPLVDVAATAEPLFATETIAEPVPLDWAVMDLPLPVLVFVIRKQPFEAVDVHEPVSGVVSAAAAPLKRNRVDPASAGTTKPREIALNMMRLSRW
jgi:hypothetical protein